MKKISIAFLVVLLLVALVGILLPTTYQVEESVVIQATPAEIHPMLEDLEQWPAWAPWEASDATIVTTYGEKTVGIGASQSWTSDSGDGELTLTSSDPATGIGYDMAFLSGDVRVPALCAMTYTESSEGTTVTWTMSGDVAEFMPPVLAGLMQPLMASNISGMFQQGLEQLKSVVEAKRTGS